MKKFTFAALAAMTALAAHADYACNPSTATVLEKGKVASVEYITLSEGAIKDFENQGATATYVGPDPSSDRNLWYWENTFSAGDESFPRVDMEEGGYISLVVGTAGWSGAGLAVGQNLDLSMLNDETHFHVAYMTPSGNGPASIGLVILNKDDGGYNSIPAKVALGAAYDDNGTMFPSIAPTITDEWQGADVTFADLKKLWPAFSPDKLATWQGNLVSILGGGVTGQTLAFDAMYFYNLEGSNGVNSVDADSAKTFSVTANTISVLGGNGIELYSMAGQLVKSTNGCVLGINNVAAGVYVAKSGNKAQKVVIR